MGLWNALSVQELPVLEQTNSEFWKSTEFKRSGGLHKGVVKQHIGISSRVREQCRRPKDTIFESNGKAFPSTILEHPSQCCNRGSRFGSRWGRCGSLFSSFDGFCKFILDGEPVRPRCIIPETQRSCKKEPPAWRSDNHCAAFWQQQRHQSHTYYQ
jgi:hypothetical protein